MSQDDNSTWSTGCLPGTKVKTATGWLNIEDVELGDNMVTDRGNAQTVVSIANRLRSGDVIEITPRKLGYTVRLTPEHPVYAVLGKFMSNGALRKPTSAFRKYEYADPQWVKAGDITKKHILLYKFDETVIDIESMKLSRILINLLSQGDKVCYANQNGHQSNWLNNEFPTDGKLMRLVGYYLADGDATDSTVRFAFANHETKYTKDVQAIIGDVFGLKHSGVAIGKCTRTTFSSKVLAQWFQKECGRSSEKHVPEWAMSLPTKKQEQLLLGYVRGDGCYSHTQDTVSSNSVSLALTLQMRELYLRCGFIPSVQQSISSGGYSGANEHLRYNLIIIGEPARRFLEKLDPGAVSKWPRKKAQGGQTWVDRGYLWLPIKKLEQRFYEGQVYNFATAEDEAYITAGFIAHSSSMTNLS